MMLSPLTGRRPASRRAARLLVPPTAEVFASGDANAHLRLEGSGEDAYVDTLIRAAREAAERYTGRAFLTQTWRLTLDALPEASVTVDLPMPPLRAIIEVRTLDEAGAATVWPASRYYADTATTPARLVRRLGEGWPVPGRARAGIEIDLEAGYGTPADVPSPLLQAVLMETARLYEHRGDGTDLPGEAARRLLDPYRVRML